MWVPGDEVIGADPKAAGHSVSHQDMRGSHHVGTADFLTAKETQRGSPFPTGDGHVWK
jgi:hypothetical protein